WSPAAKFRQGRIGVRQLILLDPFSLRHPNNAHLFARPLSSVSRTLSEITVVPDNFWKTASSVHPPMKPMSTLRGTKRPAILVHVGPSTSGEIAMSCVITNNAPAIPPAIAPNPMVRARFGTSFGALLPTASKADRAVAPEIPDNNG